jgi:hypothetical protein
MSAYLEPPLESRPPETAPGSRWESVWVLSRLAGDLLSIPFHLVAFLMTRGRHRRTFRIALDEGARSLRAAASHGVATPGPDSHRETTV